MKKTGCASHHLGPPERVRSDEELKRKLREKLVYELGRPMDFYTHAFLIAAVERILTEAKLQENFRKVQEAIPYEPEDD